MDTEHPYIELPSFGIHPTGGIPLTLRPGVCGSAAIEWDVPLLLQPVLDLLTCTWDNSSNTWDQWLYTLCDS